MREGGREGGGKEEERKEKGGGRSCSEMKEVSEDIQHNRIQAFRHIMRLTIPSPLHPLTPPPSHLSTLSPQVFLILFHYHVCLASLLRHRDRHDFTIKDTTLRSLC